MENFAVYEESIYKINKAIDLLEEGHKQKSARKVVTSYKSIDDTDISDETDLRAYVESIIGTIRSDKKDDSVKYMIELRNEISRFQEEELSSLNTA